MSEYKGQLIGDDEWCEFCSESLPCSCFTDEDDENDRDTFDEPWDPIH